MATRATAGKLALAAMTTVVLSGCGGPPFEELGTVPEYTTVKTDDISRPNAVRYRIEVLVAKAGLSRADLEAVAQAVINEFVEGRDVNAIAILVLEPDAQIGTPQLVANFTWAPNGNLSDASTVSAGDYSSHRLVGR